MVFFYADPAVLSQQERQRLAQIIRRGDPDQVCLIDPDPRRRLVFHAIGHTDDSGSETANEQLGLRRAQNVADYLVELGVAREYICVSSKGSKFQLVKANGPELQNRRVEIDVTLLKPGKEPCQ
ncbi:MAG: OmpA family protein [Alphaproteobacteria bacterium]|jgi:outer membrane protein OmpA-like peptidoglycan-associated protein